MDAMSQNERKIFYSKIILAWAKFWAALHKPNTRTSSIPMHTFLPKPKTTQPTMCTKSSSLRRTHVGHGQDPNPILNLQNDAQERNAVLADMALPRFGYDFARIPINPPKAGALQTKLTFNQQRDVCEQEADCVAEQVMTMPEPTTPLAGSITPLIHGQGDAPEH